MVEADVGGEAGRLEQAPVGLHEVVAPANRAEGIREDEPGVGPGLGGHTLLGLAGAVGFQDLGGAGPDTDAELLAGLGGRDARLSGGGVRGLADCDGGLARVVP